MNNANVNPNALPAGPSLRQAPTRNQSFHCDEEEASTDTSAAFVGHDMPISLRLDGTQAHLAAGPCSGKEIRSLIAGLRHVVIYPRCEEYWISFVASEMDSERLICIPGTYVDGKQTVESNMAITSLVVWRVLPNGTRRKVWEGAALVQLTEIPLHGFEPGIEVVEMASDEPEDHLLGNSNDGPRFSWTNDCIAPPWADKIIVTANPGHALLHIPECMECELPDMMRGTTRIEVETLEPWQSREGRHSFEWTFVNGTDQPYVIQAGFGALFCEVTPQDENIARTSLWVRRDGHPHRYAELPLIWRTAPAHRDGSLIR